MTTTSVLQLPQDFTLKWLLSSVFLFIKISSCYTYWLCNCFAQSSPHPPLLEPPTGASGFFPLLSTHHSKPLVMGEIMHANPWAASVCVHLVSPSVSWNFKWFVCLSHLSQDSADQHYGSSIHQPSVRNPTSHKYMDPVQDKISRSCFFHLGVNSWEVVFLR